MCKARMGGGGKRGGKKGKIDVATRVEGSRIPKFRI